MLPLNDMPAPRKSSSKPKSKRSPSAAKEMPEQCARVILHLADGTQVRGIWTGQKWWADKREVQPIHWEYPQSMIRRQRKAAKSQNGHREPAKREQKESMVAVECTMEGSK
jgi:hypothetical protein